ncbi:MAG: peptidoglycan DD-metalloendopeptidase family protein [Spirochaetaceae bacterium]
MRFTVMLIPHSERKVINFHINMVTILFVGVIVVAVAGGFFYFSTMYTGSARMITEKSERLEQSEASLESVLDELAEVVKVAETFDLSLAQTLEELDIGSLEEGEQELASAGDLASFLDIRSVERDELRELQQLRSIAANLRASVEPLESIREVIHSQQDLLADIPNYWPLVAGRGRVTMEFGPNIHPVTSQWYLHKGFDIADSVGVPVVSSGNGKVVELGFDPGYGMYVWLRHKYGFRTRYSHLQSISVSEGDDVVQGQVIGTLGNTGISTGPHLDFQIWLGTDVVDPAAFLKISNDWQRWSGNRPLE